MATYREHKYVSAGSAFADDMDESVNGFRSTIAGLIFISALVVPVVMLAQYHWILCGLAGAGIFYFGLVVAPDPDAPTKGDESWRSLPPTKKQMDYAHDMGIENPERFTRGGLSDELSEVTEYSFDDDDEDEGFGWFLRSPNVSSLPVN